MELVVVAVGEEASSDNPWEDLRSNQDEDWWQGPTDSEGSTRSDLRDVHDGIGADTSSQDSDGGVDLRDEGGADTGTLEHERSRLISFHVTHEQRGIVSTIAMPGDVTVAQFEEVHAARTIRWHWWRRTW